MLRNNKYYVNLTIVDIIRLRIRANATWYFQELDTSGCSPRHRIANSLHEMNNNNRSFS